MVGELSLPEMLKILGANGWKSDAARVRNNKIPMNHPDKTFPDNYVISHFPHPGSHYRQNQVRYYLSQAGVSWEQALQALK